MLSVLTRLNCSPTHRPEPCLGLAFLPVAPAGLKLCWLSAGQILKSLQALGIGGSPRGRAEHPRGPWVGLSTPAFMFSFLFTAAFSSSLFGECIKRYCMWVHACFRQTALSPMLFALSYKLVAVVKRFDVRFPPVRLMESWKPSFSPVWPLYLRLPGFSHLSVIEMGGNLNVSHFKMFFLRCWLSGSHLRKPGVSACSHANILFTW